MNNSFSSATVVLLILSLVQVSLENSPSHDLAAIDFSAPIPSQWLVTIFIWLNTWFKMSK